MARIVFCEYEQRETEGLDFAPWPGEPGQRVLARIGKGAWSKWLAHQTMLINENRLNLVDAKHRKYLSEQLEKHFFGEGADQIQGYVPPKA